MDDSKSTSLPPANAFCLYVGKCGTRMSRVVRYILKDQKGFESAVVMTDGKLAKKVYKPIIPHVYIHDHLDSELLQTVLYRSTRIKSLTTCVIIDLKSYSDISLDAISSFIIEARQLGNIGIHIRAPNVVSSFREIEPDYIILPKPKEDAVKKWWMEQFPPIQIEEDKEEEEKETNQVIQLDVAKKSTTRWLLPSKKQDEIQFVDYDEDWNQKYMTSLKNSYGNV